MLGLFGIDLCHLQTTRVPDHAPFVIVIHSERLKHSTSPRNQSEKHPDSGCLGISGVVIGLGLSKGLRSGPEPFHAGHFEDSKPGTAHEKHLAPRVFLQVFETRNLNLIRVMGVLKELKPEVGLHNHLITQGEFVA